LILPCISKAQTQQFDLDLQDGMYLEPS